MTRQFTNHVAVLLLLPLFGMAQVTLPAPPTALALIGAPVTNRPVTVSVAPLSTNRLYHTNSFSIAELVITNRVSTNLGLLLISNVVQTVTTATVLQFAPPTNYLITATSGTNRDIAYTNLSGVVTNRSLVMWISPTNKYVFTLWLLLADGQRLLQEHRDWPASPSNQVQFVWRAEFSSDFKTWLEGSNTYSFTVTNSNEFGPNQFLRMRGLAMRDDFTPRAVQFGPDSFQLFPTNHQ